MTLHKFVFLFILSFITLNHSWGAGQNLFSDYNGKEERKMAVAAVASIHDIDWFAADDEVESGSEVDWEPAVNGETFKTADARNRVIKIARELLTVPGLDFSLPFFGFDPKDQKAMGEFRTFLQSTIEPQLPALEYLRASPLGWLEELQEQSPNRNMLLVGWLGSFQYLLNVRKPAEDKRNLRKEDERRVLSHAYWYSRQLMSGRVIRFRGHVTDLQAKTYLHTAVNNGNFLAEETGYFDEAVMNYILSEFNVLQGESLRDLRNAAAVTTLTLAYTTALALKAKVEREVALLHLETLTNALQGFYALQVAQMVVLTSIQDFINRTVCADRSFKLGQKQEDKACLQYSLPTRAHQMIRGIQHKIQWITDIPIDVVRDIISLFLFPSDSQKHLQILRTQENGTDYVFEITHPVLHDKESRLPPLRIPVPINTTIWTYSPASADQTGFLVTVPQDVEAELYDAWLDKPNTPQEKIEVFRMLASWVLNLYKVPSVGLYPSYDPLGSYTAALTAPSHGA